jgi:hypothetical protein
MLSYLIDNLNAILAFMVKALLILVSLAAMVAALAIWMKRRLREQRRAEETAARLFEEGIMRAHHKPEAETTDQTALEPEAHESMNSSPNADETSEPAEIDEDPMEAVIKKLLLANILETREEAFAFSDGLPKARFLKMKGGGRAVLFPAGTPPEAYLERLRAGEILFLIQPDGSVLAGRSLSDFIADQIFQA